MNIEPTEYQDACEHMQQRAFSSVAHDLKTPLACIIGSLEALDTMKEKLSVEQHNTLVQVALGQAHRLDVLFTTMLDRVAPK